MASFDSYRVSLQAVLICNTEAKPSNVGLMLQAKVQEVYMHMVQHIKVITIKGKPGIGKTQVGIRMSAYVDGVSMVGNYQLTTYDHVGVKTWGTYVKGRNGMQA